MEMVLRPLARSYQYATPRANVAYGGLKQSGLGKELESMLEHFTSSKTVIINRGRRN